MSEAGRIEVEAAVRERPPLATPVDPEAVEIRRFVPADALGVARLVYAAEGAWAFQGALLDPAELRRRNAADLMRSWVATYGGNVIGHTATEPQPGSAAWSSGRLFVDDRARHLNLAERLKRASLAERPPDISAFVTSTLTAHPFSQRVHLALGLTETALELGYMPWPGFAPAPPAPPGVRRDAVLRFTLPCRPSTRPAQLPARYRDVLEETYARLGIDTTAATTAAPRDEAISVDRDTLLGTVAISVPTTGPGWEDAWDAALTDALATGAAMVYADVRLPGNDVKAAVARLNADGFAYAGLLLGEGPAGEDALRLQLPLPGAGVLDAHATASPWAAELRAYVLADHARVGGGA